MTTVTFRSDAQLDALLDDLAHPGETRSDTIRRALHDARTLARREQMRAEALACAHDQGDLDESRRVRSDLEDLRAW